MTVTAGHFTTEQFSDGGQPLEHGVYNIDVEMLLPQLQSDQVQAVLGSRGERIRGTHVVQATPNTLTFSYNADVQLGPPAIVANSAQSSVYRITAEALYEAYEANEVAADQTIGHSVVEVRGNIASIDKDFLDNVVVHLMISSEYESVGLSMRDSERASTARLKKFQSIVVRCETMRRVLGSPQGDHCVPVTEAQSTIADRPNPVTPAPARAAPARTGPAAAAVPLGAMWPIPGVLAAAQGAGATAAAPAPALVKPPALHADVLQVGNAERFRDEVRYLARTYLKIA